MKAGWIVRLVALSLSLLMAGCSMFGEKEPAPPCPPILVLKEAGTLRVYRPGSGRDITDLSFEGKIANFHAVCEYSKDKSKADITLSVLFELRRGPANTDRKAAFSYFVAVPKFHPAPQGKKTFAVSAEFPERTNLMRYLDEVHLQIPFTKGTPLSDYAVYLGFQLTHEQLKENRQNEAR